MTTSASEVAAGPVTQSTPAWRLKPWQEMALLFFIPILLNIQSLGFDLLYVDDFTYFTHPSLHGGGAQGLVDIWRTTILSDYSPVTQLTIWIDAALFGTKSWWGARLHEIAWFGVGTLAFYAIAARLTKRRDLAFFAALLYALHPVCAQSNLWLAERKNLVALALSLWSLERYIAAREKGSLREALGPALAAFALTAVALLAKPHAVAAVAMMAAYEMSLAKGKWWQRVTWLVPYGVISFGFIAASLRMVRTDLNRELLGGSVATAALGDGPILLRYLWNTIYPLRLTLYYAVSEPRINDLWLYGAWAIVIAIVALSVLLARRRALLLYCWMFALAGLGPALNLVPQLAPMTDHYHQWALPGLLLGLIVLLHERLELRAEAPRHNGGMLLACGLALFWGIISLSRVPEFTTFKTFFTAAVVKEPDAAMNWAIFCNALRADPNPTPENLELRGSAGLRALKCPDSHRLIDNVRVVSIQDAAQSYHLAKRTEEGWAFARRETGKMVDANEARVVLGEIALRMDKPAETVKLLAQDFNELCQKAAKILRDECRSGAKLPIQFPPLLNLNGTDAEDLERSRDLTRRALLYLAEGYTRTNELERAWDVAAVAANFDPLSLEARARLAAVYKKLGVPEAAEALKKVGLNE